jgi:antitoxin component of RelBE/YafQ-DinJ toxin-antitoxin module
MTTKTKAFTIRADENLISAFHHACSNTDTTASQAIRGFMREYVSKHGQADLFTTPKKTTKGSK